MSNARNADTPHAEQREQPFLYSWNRRLRHLHGVSLRNLDLNQTASRTRSKTITDDDFTLKTTTRSLIQDEARVIHHAKSYDQLAKPLNESPKVSPQVGTTNKHANEAPKRPMKGAMRRRSTLHWASSSPRARQTKLEALELNRLVASWFSIHHEELEQPLYVSEVMESSMNPSFSFFDLDPSVAYLTRSDKFTLRIWSKHEHMHEYKVLVELNINMRSLQFIGRSLEHFHHPLPVNCILLHLSDGIYTSFTDLPSEAQHQPSVTAAMKASAPVQAASFDALIKLSNLDDVLQDALHTRAKLEADINRLLARMPQAEYALSRLSTQRGTDRNTKRARDTERKSIEQYNKLKEDLNSSLRSRRHIIDEFSRNQQRSLHNQEQLKNLVQQCHKRLGVLLDTTTGQVRRICTTLLHIFPIEPIKNKALQFSIRNIHLANSSYDGSNRDEIAAALGHTAQLVHLLSLYLSIPLPYPIEPYHTNPSIRDDISASIAQRQFLLQPTGAAYKFEYGVFILNKDIEFLMSRSGLRVMDVRHTLPNLKYLLFVLTAGSGEVPGRVAAPIRGLLRGIASPIVSRRNSEESVSSQASTTFSDGKHGGPSQHEKPGDIDEFFSGPVRARGLPYRKSMLRDTG